MAGNLALVAWLLSFAAKLAALGWALRLRLSRSAFVVPLLGALGLVVITRSSATGTTTATLVLGATFFVVAAAGLWTTREVTSEEPLDAWGRTVLRRGLTATWATWSVLWAMHAIFWASDRGVSLGVLIPVSLLLITRLAEREAHVWGGVSAAIAWTWLAQPTTMALTAVLTACTLALYALRAPRRAEQHRWEASPAGPYREPNDSEGPSDPVPSRVDFGLAPAAIRRRLLTGALAATYLSLWTLGWGGGSLPAPMIPLEVGLAVVVVFSWVRLGAREPLAVLLAVAGHRAVVAGWMPDTRLEWGLASVASGFALLFASLGAAYWLRPREGSDARTATLTGGETN